MVATSRHGFDGAAFHERFKVCQAVADTASDFSVAGRFAKMPAGLQGFDGPVQKGGRVLLVHEALAGGDGVRADLNDSLPFHVTSSKANKKK